jgi:hypothetical protein
MTREIFMAAALLAGLWGCGRNSSRQQVARLDPHQAKPSAIPAATLKDSRHPLPHGPHHCVIEPDGVWCSSPLFPLLSSGELAQHANPASISSATVRSDAGQPKPRHSSLMGYRPGSEHSATRQSALRRPLVIPAGQSFQVRMEQSIDTKRNRPGDQFKASLVTPLLLDGRTIVPKRTLFTGHVTESKPSGRLRGRAILGLELDSFAIDNVMYPVITAPNTQASGGRLQHNSVPVGVTSGLGTTVGAIAVGTAGVLIKAGTSAGTAGAFFKARKNVSLPAETVLTFKLQRDVQVR